MDKATTIKSKVFFMKGLIKQPFLGYWIISLHGKIAGTFSKRDCKNANESTQGFRGLQ